MIVLSLFDGMSCGMLALKKAGIEVTTYYASEIDKFAIAESTANFPEIIRLGDINHWRDWDIDWESIDLIIGGSPCQGFSVAGGQLAFDDPRSALFFTFVDILGHVEELNPKVKFMLENVAMKREWVDIINGYLGTEPHNINSNIVSAQNRNRLYWTNFYFTYPTSKDICYQDILEANEARLEKAPALTATYYKGGGEATRQRNFLRGQRPIAWIDDNNTRHLSVVECCRLQTVPEDYFKVSSKTQAYKMLGNGWTIDVITEIFKGLVNETLDNPDGEVA